MTLGMEVCLGPSDFVLDGDPARPQKGQSPPPEFLVHVYCGQTALWIKMALGMEVGLSPGVFVFDVDTAPSPKGGGTLNFWSMFIAAKRMHGSRCHLVRR